MKKSLLLIFMFTMVFTVVGDSIGYNEVLNIKITSNKYILKHHHNWSASTREKRWKMISTNQDPFTSNNNYSYLECKKGETGETIFKIPTPAFTHIYIDESEKYIVCLSNIKLWNPYQFVLLNSKGDIIRKLNTNSIRDLSKNTSESVSNWIYWYDETKTNIKFHYNKENRNLEYVTILDKKGEIIKIKAGNKN